MSQIFHMKGPKKEGQRNNVLFPTKADLVEGLNEKLEEATGGVSAATADEQGAGLVKLYSTTGNNTDGTITQAAITTALSGLSTTVSGLSTALQNKVGVNDTISSDKIVMAGGSTLQESWNAGGGGGGSDTLALSETSGEIKVGKTGTFAIATTSNEPINVVSSDTSIATVSLSGTTATVSGLSVGHTTITVTVGNLTATYTAIVRAC